MAEQQKLVVQKIIYNGIDRQLSAKSIADKLINNIGLNAPQTEILQNLENNLINSNTNKTTINKIIEQKSKQFLKIRAETIALTESANAISAGRYLMQQQMYDDGDISSDTTQEWYTASSERTCSVCAPMHGQKVKMNELFTTGS